jgi:hypothetical protein
VGIAIEGRGLPFDPTDAQAQPQAPAIPPPTGSAQAPQLHLPAELPEDNRRYLLWSTDGFPKLVNGRSSTEPPFTQKLIDDMASFPDRASLAELRRAGVASVIVHLDRIAATAQAGIEDRPVSGLGLAVRRDGSLLIYELGAPRGVAATEAHRDDDNGGG